jgi:hypothetical protein
MNKRILYTNTAGGLSVIIPAPADQRPGESEADFLARVAAQAVPDGAAFDIVDAAVLPDRTFRNAWRKQGADITHDIPAAREIAHEKRRAARAAEFAPLDIDATIPAKAQQAEAKRQALRNKYDAMQVAMDAAQDVAALKALLP